MLGDALASLLGVWKDEQGSTYELTEQNPGWSLTVTTIRPDGTMRCTPGLIRVEMYRGVENVAWGKGFILQDLFSPARDEIVWANKDRGRKSFRWVRVPGSKPEPQRKPHAPVQAPPQRLLEYAVPKSRSVPPTVVEPRSRQPVPAPVAEKSTLSGAGPKNALATEKAPEKAREKALEKAPEKAPEKDKEKAPEKKAEKAAVVKSEPSSSTDNAQASEQIEVGSRVEAKFRQQWYVGTVRHLPAADKEKKGRYAVQCDVDKPGILTKTATVRLAVAASTAGKTAAIEEAKPVEPPVAETAEAQNSASAKVDAPSAAVSTNSAENKCQQAKEEAMAVAARIAEEKAAQEKAETAAVAQEAAKAAKAAEERAVRERAQEAVAREKAKAEARTKADAAKNSTQKAALEKAAAEKLAKLKAEVAKAAESRAAAEKTSHRKAEAEKDALQQATAKALRDKEAAEKDVIEKVAAEKSAREKARAASSNVRKFGHDIKAVEELVVEKNAAQKLAYQTAAVEMAAAAKLATEQEEVQKLVSQKKANIKDVLETINELRSTVAKLMEEKVAGEVRVNEKSEEKKAAFAKSKAQELIARQAEEDRTRASETCEDLKREERSLKKKAEAEAEALQKASEKRRAVEKVTKEKVQHYRSLSDEMSKVSKMAAERKRVASAERDTLEKALLEQRAADKTAAEKARSYRAMADQLERASKLADELEHQDPLNVGDMVLRKGQEAVVVKIDRTLDPPSFTVRMLADGKEVGTERKLLTKLSQAVPASAPPAVLQESRPLALPTTAPPAVVEVSRPPAVPTAAPPAAVQESRPPAIPTTAPPAVVQESRPAEVEESRPPSVSTAVPSAVVEESRLPAEDLDCRSSVPSAPQSQATNAKSMDVDNSENAARQASSSNPVASMPTQAHLQSANTPDLKSKSCLSNTPSKILPFAKKRPASDCIRARGSVARFVEPFYKRQRTAGSKVWPMSPTEVAPEASASSVVHAAAPKAPAVTNAEASASPVVTGADASTTPAATTAEAPRSSASSSDPPEKMGLQRCVELLEAIPSSQRELPPCASYCFDWLSHGNCKRPRCSYRHSPHLPTSAAVDDGCKLGFAINDAFKRWNNKALSKLSSQLPERRCFVLDGANCATVCALGRKYDEILAPNVDPDAATSLGKKCLTACSTASVALETAAKCGITFGCIYLDYMWPLDYFEKRTARLKKLPQDAERGLAIQQFLEADLCKLDGLQDISRLLGNDGASSSLVSPHGALLAVTLVSDQRSTKQQQQAQLERLLSSGCQRLGLKCLPLGMYDAKGRNVTTIFYGMGLETAEVKNVPHLEYGKLLNRAGQKGRGKRGGRKRAAKVKGTIRKRWKQV